MVQTLRRNWWALLIRGLAAIAFGVIALWHPILAGIALIVLFGAYAFVDGAFAVYSAVAAAEKHARWWPFAIEGVVGLAIGVITWFEPAATGFALYWLIAAWAVITGVFEIMAAVQLRKSIAGEIWLIVAGALSILFGILLWAMPAAGVVTLLWLIGVYAILFGILWIGLALRLRNHGSVLDGTSPS